MIDQIKDKGEKGFLLQAQVRLWMGRGKSIIKLPILVAAGSP